MKIERCADCIGGYSCEALNGACLRPQHHSKDDLPPPAERRLRDAAEIACRMRRNGSSDEALAYLIDALCKVTGAPL